MRPYKNCNVLNSHKVSIHAPTRGATPFAKILQGEITFQSTHLREVRQVMRFFSESANLFQSTHLREVRHSTLPFFSMMFASFNPRTYERCDGAYVEAWHYATVSIHAPTRGATNPPPQPCTPYPVSIHAPTRGATSKKGSVWFVLMVSIHAPTRGATLTDFTAIC